jgi:hypothetical protein
VILLPGLAVAGTDLLLAPHGPPPGDAQAYPTRGGLGAVLILQGFWRTDPADTVAGRVAPWLAAGLLLVLVVAVAAGFVVAWREDLELAAPALAVTLLGAVLASGLLSTDVAGDAQQWTGLVLVGYLVPIGYAAQWLALRLRSRLRVLPAVVVAIPLLLAPAMVWGLAGSVQPSRYPLGWHGADLVMGQGEGAVLFLPWHAYQPFRFTGDRTVATPAAAFFRRAVLSSDAVELPNQRTASTAEETALVTRVLADAGGGDIASRLAPLGVEYIAVSAGPAATAYDWLQTDPSVRMVLRTESMVLYRVVGM